MNGAGCFIERSGKFLILLRVPEGLHGNTWGLPGGNIEDGESALDAVVREINEETGHAADKNKVLELSNFNFGNDRATYSYTVFKLMLDQDIDVVIDPTEHADYLWVTPEECYARTDLMPDFHKGLRLLGFIKE